MTKHTPAPDMTQRRAIVVVLDGAGVGALPDAAEYGDDGANTLLRVLLREGPLKLPNLFSLGLGKLLPQAQSKKSYIVKYGYHGRMAPLSPGKDTTSGHWELAGVILDQPFPVYPHGFPEEVIATFSAAIGRDILGNTAASGTQIIADLGAEHLRTGLPIVYTSADSVFQIAAHEEVVPRETLYRWCELARGILRDPHAVGRVIARPFLGKEGSFARTAGRRDYSLPPPGEALPDLVAAAGQSVAVIGKVADIFTHRGITLHRPGGNNEDTIKDLFYLLKEVRQGLIWATLGDFDTVYGHRNDSAGFAAALERFDRHLDTIIAALKPDDLLFITADHGCDPTFPTTDHTREYVPLLAYNPLFRERVDLGTRPTCADLAATAALWRKVGAPAAGNSFI